MTSKAPMPDDDLQRALERLLDRMTKRQADALALAAFATDDLAFEQYKRDPASCRAELLRELRRGRLQAAAEAREAIKPP